jgi:hypothetical protein
MILHCGCNYKYVWSKNGLDWNSAAPEVALLCFSHASILELAYRQQRALFGGEKINKNCAEDAEEKTTMPFSRSFMNLFLLLFESLQKVPWCEIQLSDGSNTTLKRRYRSGLLLSPSSLSLFAIFPDVRGFILAPA